MEKLSSAGWCVLAILAILTPTSAFPWCEYFLYQLDPGQMVPATTSQGSGLSELWICEDDMLRGSITLDISEIVTAVHIHGPAGKGENGDLLYELPLPENQRIDVVLGPIPDVEQEWLRFEYCYMDVHTETHSDGAIRGQIHHEVGVTSATWTAIKRMYE